MFLQRRAHQITALFLAKVSVFEITMAESQIALLTLERIFLVQTYGIYSIEYTRGFSGVLCATERFRDKGDQDAVIRERTLMIRDSKAIIGSHVFI